MGNVFKQIPQPTDQRNVSQGDLLGNMNYLIANTAGTAGILPVDHKASADSNANPTDGFHKQISMQNRSTPANMLNAVNGQNSDQIVYAFQGTDTRSHLGFLNAANQSICLTGLAPGVARNGHSYLPSTPGGPRLLIQWGIDPVGATSFPVSFSADFLPIVTGTANFSNLGSFGITNVTAGGFTSIGGLGSVMWIAIGPS